MSKILLEKKLRVNSEIIKKVFFGFDDRKGIIEFCLASTNELIAIEGVKFLLKLMEHEKNRDS